MKLCIWSWNEHHFRTEASKRLLPNNSLPSRWSRVEIAQFRHFFLFLLDVYIQSSACWTIQPSPHYFGSIVHRFAVSRLWSLLSIAYFSPLKFYSNPVLKTQMNLQANKVRSYFSMCLKWKPVIWHFRKIAPKFTDDSSVL